LYLGFEISSLLEILVDFTSALSLGGLALDVSWLILVEISATRVLCLIILVEVSKICNFISCIEWLWYILLGHIEDCDIACLKP
jgi:hypothetical protein